MLCLELRYCLRLCIQHSLKPSISPVQNLIHPVTNTEASPLSVPLPSPHYCMPVLCKDHIILQWDFDIWLHRIKKSEMF